MKNSNIPAPGNAPRGRGGSDRKLDHPGCGTMPKGVDNTYAVNHNAPAGGKAHRSMGGKERKESYRNAPSDLPTLSGNPPKVRSNSW